MSILQQYNQDLCQRGYLNDPAQQRAIHSLQQLSDICNRFGGNVRRPLIRMMIGARQIPGIYLWGGVGRGKTYLMDMFFNSLHFINKQRVHYDKFMFDIHEQLRVLPRSPNPLQIIGKQLARSTQVLCVDEFHVTDVADAMLLTGLLSALFKHGVTLVVTSNNRIDDLYLNGLQRERFMHAIALLNDHMVEVDLESGQDYRLLHLVGADAYLIADSQSRRIISARFQRLAPYDVNYGQRICVHHREINTVAVSHDVVWFDFHELCDTPRAAKDYLEIAQQFHTVFVSDIPLMSDAQDSAAKRFMHLIDALYDHRVKLIASAAQPPWLLYQGRLLQGQFDRTASRLIEMGSADYLAMAHRP